MLTHCYVFSLLKLDIAKGQCIETTSIYIVLRENYEAGPLRSQDTNEGLRRQVGSVFIEYTLLELKIVKNTEKKRKNNREYERRNLTN
jgi:hypothetical protein